MFLKEHTGKNIFFNSGQWQILIWKSGLAKGYTIRHCTVSQDLIPRSVLPLPAPPFEDLKFDKTSTEIVFCIMAPRNLVGGYVPDYFYFRGPAADLGSMFFRNICNHL
jgi:hypothetical protein